MGKLLVKNVRKSSGGNSAEICDVLIEKNGDSGSILRIAPSIVNVEDADVLDGSGHLILPGFVDLNCRLGDPGYQYREDIVSGTSAAVAGGYSAVLCMPDTKPSLDAPDTVSYILNKSKHMGKCAVFPIADLISERNEKKLCDLEALFSSGALAFTDDVQQINDSVLLKAAMEKCALSDYLIICRPKDVSLSGDGVINEGNISHLLKLKGIPSSSEEVALARFVLLAKETGARIHISHVSTAGSVEMIRLAKERGIRVTCDTNPQYYSLCEDDIIYYGANAKVDPPLRKKTDVKAVIEGLRDGTIDCIATGHTPCSPSEKPNDFTKAHFGMLGLQTAFKTAFTYLVLPGYMDIGRLTELLSTSPAKISGLDKRGYGTLKEGGRADFGLYSLDRDSVFAEKEIMSKSRNTPFAHMTFRGNLEAMFVDGEIRYGTLKPIKKD